MGEELQVYPIWREALRNWKQSGFTWGDTVPHAWFFNAFNLPEIVDTMTVKQAQGIELKMLRYRSDFERALRSEYRMDLVSVPGVGYEIVTPAEQSRRAWGDFTALIRRGMRDLGERLRFLALEQLTDDQRRENAHLLALAGSFARWAKHTELPESTDGS